MVEAPHPTKPASTAAAVAAVDAAAAPQPADSSQQEGLSQPQPKEDGTAAQNNASTAGNSSSQPASHPQQRPAAPVALPTPSTLVRAPQPRQCERCGYLASQPVCKACVLLEGLNK